MHPLNNRPISRPMELFCILHFPFQTKSVYQSSREYNFHTFHCISACAETSIYQFQRVGFSRVGVSASWLSASWTVGKLDCRWVGLSATWLSASWFVGELSVKRCCQWLWTNTNIVSDVILSANSNVCEGSDGEGGEEWAISPWKSKTKLCLCIQTPTCLWLEKFGVFLFHCDRMTLAHKTQNTALGSGWKTGELAISKCILYECNLHSVHVICFLHFLHCLWGTCMLPILQRLRDVVSEGVVSCEFGYWNFFRQRLQQKSPFEVTIRDVNRGSKNRHSLQIRVLGIEFSNSKLDITFCISA